MLKNLDLQSVRRVPGIIRPYLLLREPHAVKRQRRQAVAHLSELLGVGKRPADPLDGAGAAADVVRGAHVPERIGLPHLHPFAWLEFSFDHSLRPSYGQAL